MPGPALLCGSGSAMPFESSSFDTVFMLDVVEHLSQDEFDAVLVEVMRVLVGNGRLIVHTTPNRWARTYGFWVRSAAVRMAGRPAPVHPLVAQLRQLEEDPEYDARTCFLHINEQSPLSLKSSLRRAGFRSRVWLEHSANPWLGRPADRRPSAAGRHTTRSACASLFGSGAVRGRFPRATRLEEGCMHLGSLPRRPSCPLGGPVAWVSRAVVVRP